MTFEEIEVDKLYELNSSVNPSYPYLMFVVEKNYLWIKCWNLTIYGNGSTRLTEDITSRKNWNDERLGYTKHLPSKRFTFFVKGVFEG